MSATAEDNANRRSDARRATAIRKAHLRESSESTHALTCWIVDKSRRGLGLIYRGLTPPKAGSTFFWDESDSWRSQVKVQWVRPAGPQMARVGVALL